VIQHVPLEVSEEAISLLHATYLDSADPSANTSLPRGRVLRSECALGAYDVESSRRQGCFLRMISVVEAYVDIVSEHLFQESLPITHALVRRLLDDVKLRASSTWNERKAAFSSYHKIQLGEFGRWSELDAGIEVRNSIAHGLGRLTPRQREAGIESKLSQIGVRIQDGSIVISSSSLERCRDVCIDFVRYLDREIPSARSRT
jgi:hypothetical protein